MVGMENGRLKLMIFILISPVITLAMSKAKEHPQQWSLATQCEDASFLSVAARTRTRSKIPDVGLLLRDSSGLVQGQGAHADQIPMSRYREIVQLPMHPDKSKALAIEVCDAKPGIYEIEIKERGNEPYVLDVTVSGASQDTESLLLHHVGKVGVKRHYRFVFRRNKDGPVVRWLDENDEERMLIEPNDW